MEEKSSPTKDKLLSALAVPYPKQRNCKVNPGRPRQTGWHSHYKPLGSCRGWHLSGDGALLPDDPTQALAQEAVQNEDQPGDEEGRLKISETHLWNEQLGKGWEALGPLLFTRVEAIKVSLVYSLGSQTQPLSDAVGKGRMMTSKRCV